MSEGCIAHALKPFLKECDRISGSTTCVSINQKTEILFQGFQFVVGETGFEPATLRSQSECATGLRHSPPFFKD